MKYYGMGMDGNIHVFGEYETDDDFDMDVAEELAADIEHMIWITGESEALAWCDTILSSTFGVTTSDIADWDLIEEDE